MARERLSEAAGVLDPAQRALLEGAVARGRTTCRTFRPRHLRRSSLHGKCLPCAARCRSKRAPRCGVRGRPAALDTARQMDRRRGAEVANKIALTNSSVHTIWLPMV